MIDEAYDGKGEEGARVIETDGEEKEGMEIVVKQEDGVSPILQQAARFESDGSRKRALSHGDVAESVDESEALKLELRKTDLEIQNRELELKKIELQQRLLQKRRIV